MLSTRTQQPHSQTGHSGQNQQIGTTGQAPEQVSQKDFAQRIEQNAQGIRETTIHVLLGFNTPRELEAAVLEAIVPQIPEDGISVAEGHFEPSLAYDAYSWNPFAAYQSLVRRALTPQERKFLATVTPTAMPALIESGSLGVYVTPTTTVREQVGKTPLDALTAIVGRGAQLTDLGYIASIGANPENREQVLEIFEKNDVLILGVSNADFPSTPFAFVIHKGFSGLSWVQQTSMVPACATFVAESSAQDN